MELQKQVWYLDAFLLSIDNFKEIIIYSDALKNYTKYFTSYGK